MTARTRGVAAGRWLRQAAAAARHSGPAGLFALAALCVAATFARPQITLPQSQHDLVVVLDVTESMSAADLQRDGNPVTRLDQAKWALDRVLHRLPCGSRVGWGLFTEYRSFLLLQPVEVCEHQNELLATLSAIDGRIAWTGNSEIAKGLYSGLRIAKELPSHPALVFVTDGQEAPPVHPKYRPSSEGAVRAAPGLIVGAGGLRPVPIPKHDPQGRPLGVWRADEVMQIDPRTAGSGDASLVESAPPMVGATPGSEHLSALREPYLQLLASETGLRYHRLDQPDTAGALFDAITDARLSHRVPARVDLRGLFGLVALAAVVVACAGPPSGWRWVAALARWRRQRGGGSGGRRGGPRGGSRVSSRVSSRGDSRSDMRVSSGGSSGGSSRVSSASAGPGDPPAGPPDPRARAAAAR